MIKHDWQYEEVLALLTQPFMDLMFQAQTVHRQNFDANQIQLSMLLSIKTGACPEDCAYCPQSGHYHTNITKERLLSADKIIEAALEAKKLGASRFCMGAAWKAIPAKAMPQITEAIKQVKELGLETCMTLGKLNHAEAAQLKDAGLDYYNHNIDTSPEYYKKIITTRSFEERLDTLQAVREVDLKTCCGGILGMGESQEDRINFLLQLANLPEHPQSVPLNRLIRIQGTPLEDAKELAGFDFVRTIAVARIMMPKSVIRLAAGRENMNEELQALCFLAGVNSIFFGDKLLTSDNQSMPEDQELMNKLGLQPMVVENSVCS